MNWVVRNWLLVGAWVLGVSLLSSYLQGGAHQAVGSAIVAVGWGSIIVLALVDGTWRALGKRSFLGTGQGLGRVLAVVQIVLALGTLANLLALFSWTGG